MAEAPLDGAAAALAGGWTGLHDDAADRFIVATALRMGASLVTSDRRLLAWAHTVAMPALDARM